MTDDTGGAYGDYCIDIQSQLALFGSKLLSVTAIIFK